MRRKGSDPVSKNLHWLLGSVPDSAYIAGTKFPCALVEDDCELNLITRLELQTILHLFYVEEQFFAFTNFICDETKLQRGKTNSEQRHFNLTLNIVACDKICTRPIKKATWSLTHSTKALRCGITIHAIFCPVCATVQTWNFTGSPFWRQSALLAILIIPNGIFWHLLAPETKKAEWLTSYLSELLMFTSSH